MSEALISTSQECYLPVINIPSIAEAMEEMKTSMELASMHFQEAALSIERRVLDSNFLEESAYDEATAHVALLLQSTFNLEIARNEIEAGIDIITVLNEKTAFFKSNGEARRALASNSISVNKEKVKEDFVLSATDLINNQFVLLQSGKKNYFVIRIV